MKKFTGLLLLLVLTVLSCSKYDDSEIWDYVKGLNTRLTTLEEKCKEMNTNISSLQTLVGAVESGDYITNVAPVTKDGKTIGYTISFRRSQAITIYNGTDGYAPVIGVKKDVDGLYYWTIDGEWLKDGEGHKVQASGTNGENGTTPQLKIENEYWYVSYDSGATWQVLGKATGPKGNDGNTLFSSVEVGSNEVIFVLADGTSFSIPLNHSTNNYYESVNLDLPSGTLWATCNVGASSPEEYGSYFAWGETIPKDVYDARFYKYGDGTEKGMIKYSGDGKTELEPQDDAATTNWGDDWQMPNRSQFEELINSNYTTILMTTQKDIYGMLITSKNNSNSIFLPCAGSWSGATFYEGGFCYWSRSVRTDYGNAHEAIALFDNMDYSGNRVRDTWRIYGHSVRPVRKQ